MLGDDESLNAMFLKGLITMCAAECGRILSSLCSARHGRARAAQPSGARRGEVRRVSRVERPASLRSGDLGSGQCRAARGGGVGGTYPGLGNKSTS